MGRAGGLRDLYRSLELPGRNDLRSAHDSLDQVVMSTYAFEAGDDIISSLSGLNAAIAERLEQGATVVSPGLLSSAGTDTFVTTDCYPPGE